MFNDLLNYIKRKFGFADDKLYQTKQVIALKWKQLCGLNVQFYVNKHNKDIDSDQNDTENIYLSRLGNDPSENLKISS